MGRRSERHDRRSGGRRYRSALTDSRMQKPRRRLNWKNVAILVCGAVLAVSLMKLIHYGISSAQRRDTSQELQALHNAGQATDSAIIQLPTQAPATPAPQAAATPEPATAQPAVRQTAYGKIMPATPSPGGTPKPVYQQIGTNKQFLAEMRALYWKNKDTIGWINIPGVVDLPVVYRDNVYYLTHDFNGKTNNGGTLFLDVLHPFKESTQHLVIHGHNMKDGSMFAHLTHYQSPSYARDHGRINWSSMYRKEVYEIYAVDVISTDYQSPRYIAYLGTSSFKTEDQFNAFMAQVKQNAVYWKGIEVKPTDALITLSTCLEDDRILVMGNRVSP